MALAQRPSVPLSEKQNVNPSLNRITEATAEDFQEIAAILNSFADRFDGMVQPAKFYLFHTSLAVLQAAHPDAEEGGWAVIVPDNGNTQFVATFTNGVWTATQVVAPIQYFNTKIDRPDPGVEGVFYVVKDEKILYLWYDGGYKPFGKDGNNGLSAFQVAQAFGFPGNEAEWLATLVGKSAYQSAVDTGFVGTEAEWIASVQGVEGKSAYQIALDNGFIGTEAEWLASIEGVEGKSAYEVAVANGFIGTEAKWLTSLEGAPGDAGEEGPSAYEVAVTNGFQGTEAEWIASIEGVEGKSAYEVAVANGFVGTEAEWLASLEGEPGEVTNQQLTDALANKVDKIAGKGLSTNDLTNELKTAYDLAAQPAQITKTTTTSITSETLSDGNYSQNGKNVLIANSTNAINITVGATANFVASYQKEGTGAITFLASSGKTIRAVDGTNILNGAVGSTATVSVVGNIVSLRISNAT